MLINADDPRLQWFSGPWKLPQKDRITHKHSAASVSFCKKTYDFEFPSGLIKYLSIYLSIYDPLSMHICHTAIMPPILAKYAIGLFTDKVNV